MVVVTTVALTFKSFSVGYAGIYDTYGTKINIRIELVVSKPIILKKQQEWCDGKTVLDYSYPTNQPRTEVGTYVYEEKDYAHIPFRLPFSLLGHMYKIRFEYLDTTDNLTYSVEAQARFFTPEEIMALALGTAAGACVLTLTVTKWLKWW